MQENCTRLLHFAASVGSLPCVKALVGHGVPCSDSALSTVLWSRGLEMPAYLIETNPELLTAEAVRRLAFRGHHAYLRTLHASHPYLFQSVLVEEVLQYNEEEPPTWEMLDFLYELFGSSPLDEHTIDLLWIGHSDDVLVFMSLVWPHEDLIASLSAGDRGHRIRFYSRHPRSRGATSSAASSRELHPKRSHTWMSNAHAPWGRRLKPLHQAMNSSTSGLFPSISANS